MKLIAKVNVKHGKAGETAAPGEPFEVADDVAKDLIGAGAAATPKDYEREQRASRSAEDRIAELEQELATAKGENEQLKADLEAATKGKK
jgi:hypothetical protein